MKEKLLGVFLLVFWLFLGFCMSLLITSNGFIKFLELNRVSVYFIQDCISFLKAAGIISCLIVFVRPKNASKKLKDILISLFLLVLTFDMVMRWYYPSVPRVEIGYFYRTPIGESITYPKYPKNKMIVNDRVHP